MILKIELTYFTKGNVITEKLSDAAEVLMVGEIGFDYSFPIDTESIRNALPKDLSNVDRYYPFTEKEWAAFDAVFDVGQHDDDEDAKEEEEELKTAAATGEKFKLDSGYAR